LRSPVCGQKKNVVFGPFRPVKSGTRARLAMTSRTRGTPTAVAGVRPEQLAGVDSLRAMRRWHAPTICYSGPTHLRGCGL
jgi:hypothetical protein